MVLDVDKKCMATDRMYMFVCGLIKVAVSNSEYSLEIGPDNRKVLYKKLLCVYNNKHAELMDVAVTST
jgi:hypothetical protein